jgi:hypothetical protein
MNETQRSSIAEAGLETPSDILNCRQTNRCACNDGSINHGREAVKKSVTSTMNDTRLCWSMGRAKRIMGAVVVVCGG